MRDLEFLPTWYRQMRQRRRSVIFHAWLLVLLIAGLGGWMGLVNRNVHARELELTSLNDELEQTRAKQKILTKQLELRQELQARAQLVSSLGYPLEMTRLIQTLDGIMPPSMSMTELDCSIEEHQKQTTSVAAVRAGEKNQEMDRKLRVRVRGVSPTGVDLANFLSGLNSIQFFEQAAIKTSRDVVENGHVLREFEVVFLVNLNQ